MTGRPLAKREVETLLASCEGATSSALEEITMVRAALAVPLGRLLDAADAPWRDLITRAATAGGWSHERRDVLAAAAQPDTHPDPDAVLDALWDLVQELNERRTL
jgi:hypothetical protein